MIMDDLCNKGYSYLIDTSGVIWERKTETCENISKICSVIGSSWSVLLRVHIFNSVIDWILSFFCVLYPNLSDNVQRNVHCNGLSSNIIDYDNVPSRSLPSTWLFSHPLKQSFHHHKIFLNSIPPFPFRVLSWIQWQNSYTFTQKDWKPQHILKFQQLHLINSIHLCRYSNHL